MTTTTDPGAVPSPPLPRPWTGGVVERDGFDAFVTARANALLRTAYLLTRDRGLAEDLVQTSLAKAWFAWGRIEGQPDAYVRRIMVNTYSSWWRRRWNGEEATADLPESPTSTGRHDRSPGRESSRVEERTDLWRALGRLPKRQRAVVVLRFYEDLSEAETAEIMQCSVGTVKSQASRALAKLRVDPSLTETMPTSEENAR